MSNELVAAVRSVVPPKMMPDAVAQVQALLFRVTRCQAIDPDDVVPVAQDANLWELRLDYRRYGLRLRIYVTEMAELPNDIVALHVHQKDVAGSPEEIRQRQNEAIRLAQQRWRDGLEARWGLV